MDMEKQKILGLGFILICFGGAMVLGGNLSLFLDIPSLLVTFGGGLGGLLIYREKEVESTELIYQFGRFSLWSGSLGTIIGIIQVLANLSNPKLIGPSMALCLLTLFYGIGAYFICFVFAKKKETLGASLLADALSVVLTLVVTASVFATIKMSIV